MTITLAIRLRTRRAAIAAVALLVLSACSTAHDNAGPELADERQSAPSTTAALSDVPSTVPPTGPPAAPPTAPPTTVAPAPPPTSTTLNPAVLTGGFTGADATVYRDSATSCSLYTADELAAEYGVYGGSAEEAALAFAQDTYRSEFWPAAQVGCLSTLG